MVSIFMILSSHHHILLGFDFSYGFRNIGAPGNRFVTRTAQCADILHPGTSAPVHHAHYMICIPQPASASGSPGFSFQGYAMLFTYPLILLDELGTDIAFPASHLDGH